MSRWKPIPTADDTDDLRWVGHDSSDRFPIYTRGNAGEVYPEVFTPLSFSVAADAGERSMRAAILATGLIRPEELDDVPLSTAVGSGVFGGYAYLNLSIQRTAAARMPGGSAADADTNYLGVGDPPPHRPIAGERNLRASVAGLAYVVRLLRRTELPELADDQRAVDDYLASLPPVDGTEDELASLNDAFIPFFERLFTRHLLVTSEAGLVVSVLAGLCEQLLDDRNRAVQLLAGLGGVDSAAPSTALWDLGRLVADDSAVAAEFDAGVKGLEARLRANPRAGGFVAAFDAFLAEHGSRGPNEWDTAFDTWETAPELALTLVDRMRGADPDHEPRKRLDELRREREALEETTLAEVPRPMRALFRRVLRVARLLSQSRERTKTTVVRAIHGARLRQMELDRRLVARSGGTRGDLWFLVEEEIDDYRADPAAFAERIAERREIHRRLAERHPPFFFDGAQPPLDDWELRSATKESVGSGEVIEGLPGCRGVSEGRARVVLTPADPGGLQPGEILVAPLTDPSWTPLFLAADGVVVDVGAVMSHAVIVSRELGIPCVVSATDATRRIPDGARIRVDGDRGVVTVLELPG